MNNDYCPKYNSCVFINGFKHTKNPTEQEKDLYENSCLNHGSKCYLLSKLETKMR